METILTHSNMKWMHTVTFKDQQVFAFVELILHPAPDNPFKEFYARSDGALF